ncbi:MAG: beta-galactosidase [Deltaproteobacteria bacterium]|nr:MAG: beta-galactosidase [Deltaproteobacteria bacterium]
MKKGTYSVQSDSLKVIQQWQYMGKVHPILLTDKAFENCKEAGITSLQSYVTWAEIERKPGLLDFSTYDVLVEKLLKHGLKWVPFLIMGPYYATPRWFQESEQSIYAKCLEHGRECSIQSIWNPYLANYVDHFISLFADHYRDRTLFESISLGISGNWGEAIYPATGGFLGEFHVHPGWWCGDDYGLADLRRFATKKYTSLATLNRRWNTNFRTFSDISFPEVKQTIWKDLSCEMIKAIPHNLKPMLKRIRHRWTETYGTSMTQLRTAFYKSHKKASIEKLQRWLDFVEWYQKSMTDWAEFWIETARRYFPINEIYLVTGGEGEPMLGADFSTQTKTAAKHRAGVRITNQNDDYGESFVRTRLVACASRHYGTYFTTEEAGVNRPHGVTMRIFDCATSGARGIYFKSIIGTGTDMCTNRNLTPGEPTKGAENLLRNMHHMSLSAPIIDLAVLFPNTSINIDHSIVGSLYNQCSALRSLTDLDLIDENMIGDGLLKEYRFLVILAGNVLRTYTLAEIRNWVTGGGILISANYLQMQSLDDDTNACHGLFSEYGGVKKVDRGYTLSFTGKRDKYLGFISDVVYNLDGNYPWEGIPKIHTHQEGAYVTRFSDKIMSYDPKIHLITVHKIGD